MSDNKQTRLDLSEAAAGDTLVSKATELKSGGFLLRWQVLPQVTGISLAGRFGSTRGMAGG